MWFKEIYLIQKVNFPKWTTSGNVKENLKLTW